MSGQEWQNVDPTHDYTEPHGSTCPFCPSAHAGQVVYARAQPHPQPVWDHVLHYHGPGEVESWIED